MSQRMKTPTVTKTQQLQIDEEKIEDYAKALESLRRQRAHVEAQKSREEVRRRQFVAEKIIGDNLEGEDAFRLMGAQDVTVNLTTATSTAAVKQDATTESSAPIEDDYPADEFLGTGPQAIVLLLSPERAAAMKAAVKKRQGTTVIQTWSISDEQSLVAYSDLASDWNAISSVATVKVMGRPRLLSLIIPVGPAFGVARVIFTAVVLGIAVFVGGLAAYVVIESIPLEIIQAAFHGDAWRLMIHLGGLWMNLRRRAVLTLRRQFQSTLALLLVFLEKMRDIRDEPPTLGF